jgi:Zn-dependent protease
MFNFSASYWIQVLLFVLPAVLLVLTLHEFGHAYAAYKLGDNTAKAMGRLSLNPLHHIDPIGFLTLLLFRFGWGKPVPVDFFALRNLRSGMVIVSLAGPLMNFLTAAILAPLYKLMLHSSVMLNNFNYFVILTQYIIVYSVYLGVFNLIPIPPLDGSKVVYAMTKRPQRWLLDDVLNNYGIILLLVLIMIPAFHFDAVLNGIVTPFLKLFL